MSGIDPITFEVVNSTLVAICRDMANTLRRTAYSPIIHDFADFSCGLVDGKGHLVAQQEGSPIHLMTMPMTVKRATEEYGLSQIGAGDILAVNDPYRGGVHLPDVALMEPVVVDGEIVAWAAARAHWPDIGGAQAGSLVANATELLQEGIRIPPVRLRVGSSKVHDVIELLMSNVRGPAERRGDLNAQMAAVDTGVARMQELIAKFGVGTIKACFQESLEYARRRIRDSLSKLPAGEYGFEDYMDDNGLDYRPIKIKVKVTLSPERIVADFTGTDPQVDGPINSAYGMTYSSSCIILKALLDPHGPGNSGWFDILDVVVPEGTILNPRDGAPVYGGGVETGQRVMDCIRGALTPLMPEVVSAAPYGTINTTWITGFRRETRERFLFIDAIPGGWGAKKESDGLPVMIALVGNIDDMPAEIIELKYPIRLLSTELRVDSGGPGRRRGGLGAVRELELLEDDAQLSIQADRAKFAPWGIFGGKEAMRTKYTLVRADGQTELLGGIEGDRYESPKRTVAMRRHDVVRIETAGGGGYGDPLDRERERVIADILDGYVSSQAAVAEYGLPQEDVAAMSDGGTEKHTNMR